MSTPHYEEYISRELENNKELTTEQRIELLKLLARVRSKKLSNQRLKLKLQGGDKKIRKSRPVKLPADEPPPKSAVELVDEALEAYNREIKDGRGQQHQPAGPDGHSGEDAAGN